MGINETTKPRQHVVRRARAAPPVKHEHQFGHLDLAEPSLLGPMFMESDADNLGLDDYSILDEIMRCDTLNDSHDTLDPFSAPVTEFSYGSLFLRPTELQSTSPNSFNSDSSYTLPTDSGSEFELDLKPVPLNTFSTNSESHSMSQRSSTEQQQKWSVQFQTAFHPNYYRNDRKHLQCFPECLEFGEYSLGRLENKKHSIKKRSNCLGDVEVKIQLPVQLNNTDENLVVLGHIKSMFSVSRDSTTYPLWSSYSKSDIEDMLKNRCYLQADIVTDSFSSTAQATFVPKGNWKCDERLDAKDKDRSLFVFCFESLVFYRESQKDKYVLVARQSSTSFELAHTRKLARMAKRIGAETSPSDGSAPPTKKHCRNH